MAGSQDVAKHAHRDVGPIEQALVGCQRDEAHDLGAVRFALAHTLVVGFVPERTA